MRHLFPNVLFLLSAIACSDATESEKVVVEIPEGDNPPSQPVLAIGPTQPTASDTLTATIVQDSIDPEGEAVIMTWKWTRNGSVVDGLTEPEVDSEETNAGEEWTVYAIPSDGTQEGLAGSATVRIVTPSGTENPEEEVNVAPSAPIVSIAPANAKTAEDLVATMVQESSDPNGDAVEIQYKWVRDGVLVEGEESESISSDLTRSGEQWTVYAIPSDGSLIGEAGMASITVQNTAPEATATLSVSSASTDEDVEVSASATDADEDAVSFSYSWTVNNQPAPEVGAVLPASKTTKGDVWSVEVTPHDGQEEGTSVSLSLSIENSAPSLSGASISESNPNESSELHCQAQGWMDADDDPEQVATEWFVNGTSVSTSEMLDGDNFSKGDEVYCVLTPSDDADTGSAVTSATVTVENAAPEIGSIVLSASAPTRSDVLSATATSSDVDGDSISYGYSWWVNGTSVSTGTSLDVSAYMPGDEIAVMMTPNDGSVDGVSVTSSSVVVQNSAPTIASLSILPASPATNDDLTVEFTTNDADGDTVNSAVQWSVNGIVLSSSGASLSSALFSKNDTVTVQLTPSDVYDVGTPSIASVSVVNTAPMIDGVDLAPASPTIEDTLTCTPSGWSDIDGDAASYRYEWTINGTTTAGTSTLDVSSLSVGDVLSCTTIPNDGDEDGSSMTSADVTVANSAPALNGLTLSTSTPYRGDTLSLSIDASDANGDTLTESIEWYVNGSMASSATELDLSTYSVGDSIYAMVTVDDGSESASMSSETVVVLNHTPSIDSASLSDLSPDTNAVLTVSVSSSDADDDALTTSYHWKVNGNSVSTDNSLDGASAFDSGDAIMLEITVDDGVGGSASQTLSATVQNSTPSVDSAFVSPDPAMASDELACGGVGWMDADDDPESYDVEWFVNGTSVSTDATITTPMISFGDDVYCTLTPNDGLNSGTSVDSAAVSISNSKPTIASLTLSESDPMAGAVLTATLGAIEDVDGDTITTTYSWTVNGAEVSTDVSFDTTSLAGGDDIVLTVTPNDGTEDGEAVTASAQIYNAKPVIDSLTLDPATAYTNDILTATATASDTDSSDITIQYEWFVNGVLVAETGSTLSGTTYFSKGDSVEVRVTPNDGNNDGTAESATVDILNSAPTTPVVLVTPSSPEGGADNLVCTLSAESMDADGDTIDYTFSWIVDSVAYTTSETTTYLGDTISGAETNEGETWECSVSTEDDEEAGGSDSDDVYVGGCTPGLDEKASLEIVQNTYCREDFYFDPWDWDRDGMTDLIILGRYIWKNTGNGFSLGATLSHSGRPVIHDWNDDGREELLYQTNLYSYDWDSTVFTHTQLLSNVYNVGHNYDNGNGSTSPYSSRDYNWHRFGDYSGTNYGYWGSDFLRDYTKIDSDNDGTYEIVLANHMSIGLGDFDGTSISNISYSEMYYQNQSSSNGASFEDIATGDLTGDGIEDVIVWASYRNYSSTPSGYELDKINIFDLSSGTPTLYTTISTNMSSMNEFSTGDVDGDGDIDLLAMGTGFSELYRNDGNGGFTLIWVSPESMDYVQGELVDVDDDGDLDILLPSRLSLVSIYLNQNGSFVPVTHSFGGQGYGVAAFDYDNDGGTDLVFSSYESSSVSSNNINTCVVYVATLSCQE